MKEYRCSECGHKSKNSVFRKSTREYIGEGYDFDLSVITPYCEKCGSPLYDKEIEQKIRETAYKMIQESRLSKKIQTKEQIEENSEGKAMSQSQAVEILTGLKENNNWGGSIPEALDMAINALKNQIEIGGNKNGND